VRCEKVVNSWSLTQLLQRERAGVCDGVTSTNDSHHLSRVTPRCNERQATGCCAHRRSPQLAVTGDRLTQPGSASLVHGDDMGRGDYGQTKDVLSNTQ